MLVFRKRCQRLMFRGSSPTVREGANESDDAPAEPPPHIRRQSRDLSFPLHHSIGWFINSTCPQPNAFTTTILI